MNAHQLDPVSARRLINSLKKGTTPLDLARHLNVGNEKWYQASEEFCSDIENDGDSMMRFINGYYGAGKTHFMGNLRTLAIQRRWMVSYASLESTPLHKWDLLYSEIVKSLIIPESVPLVPWLPGGDRRGAAALLSAFFSHWYIEAHGSDNREGTKRMELIQALADRSRKVIPRLGLHELLGKALSTFVEAAMAQDFGRVQNIAAWIEGQPVSFPELGLTRRINADLAHDFLRSLVIVAKNSGMRGALFLLDEAERIMELNFAARKRSYSVIRELLDNADGQGGLPSSMIYIAATPEMFSAPSGFPEYDALRSRLDSAKRLQLNGLIDWRSVVIDLVKTPLPSNHLALMAQKIREVHGLARQWEPKAFVTDQHLGAMIKKIESDAASQVSKPRILSSLIANLLEIVEQNRDIDPTAAVDATFQEILQLLAKRPAASAAA